MLQGGHQVSTYKSKSNWVCQKARSQACTVAGEAHPETGATSGHSRRCMQPNQKHNDNAKPLKKPKKKTARSTGTHWTLLSVDMLPKIAHACSFMGLEKGLDLG